jgi:tRNA(fMet)-specific endonuclease VapC
VWLLDTNTCIAVLRGHRRVVERLAQHDPIELQLCSVVRAELLYGARVSARPGANLRAVERFCEPFLSLPFDDGCARAYGRIRTDLQARAEMIGANDLMIAAIAVTHELVLVTHNAGAFERVADLRLADWESEPA